MTENWTTLKAKIEFFSKPFPQDAIDFAELHRDEMAPFLAEVLVQVAADPAIAFQEDYVLHQYAMHLLAIWRDARAYAPLLALGRLDDSTLDMVLGDTLTESYGRCLASVCNGDTTPIKALIESAEIDFWVRDAAVDALVVRVFEGDDERLSVLQYLMAIGEQEAARIGDANYQSEGSELIDSLVRAMANLVTIEMREPVERWFDQGLIDPNWIERDDFNVRLARTFEDTRAEILSLGQGYVSSVEAEIGGWSGFRENTQAYLPEKEGGLLLSSAVSPTHHTSGAQAAVETFVRETPKIGRNDPCSCGSGKKYKKCCGK